MNIISQKVESELKGFSGSQIIQSNNQNTTLLLRIGTTFILFSMERDGEINANKWSFVSTKYQRIMFNCCIASQTHWQVIVLSMPLFRSKGRIPSGRLGILCEKEPVSYFGR